MASDYLLEIEGVKGESQDDKHKETIEISSFSWGLSNAGSFQSGGGGGAGKANFQDIHFTTTVSKASPKKAKNSKRPVATKVALRAVAVTSSFEE